MRAREPAREVPKVEQPRRGDTILPDNVALAHPCPVYRGAGSERERQWGAATDGHAAPGDKLFIVAGSGRTWVATVDAIVGTAGNGSLVTLTGGQWQPDPELPEQSTALIASKASM